MGAKDIKSTCHCCSCRSYALHGYHAGWCHASPHDKEMTEHCDCPPCQERAQAEEEVYELLWQEFDASMDEWLRQHCNKPAMLWSHDPKFLFQYCLGCGSFVVSEFSMVEVLPIWLTGENQ